LFVGGLEYNDRIDGASTPSGRPAVTPLGDEDMRYMFTDDALPVTPAFLKNQLRYEKPRAQVICVILSLLYCRCILLDLFYSACGYTPVYTHIRLTALFPGLPR